MSNVYEDSISDNQLPIQIGFLHNPGNLVMADRGFTIRDILQTRGADLNIPHSLAKGLNSQPRGSRNKTKCKGAYSRRKPAFCDGSLHSLGDAYDAHTRA